MRSCLSYIALLSCLIYAPQLAAQTSARDPQIVRSDSLVEKAKVSRTQKNYPASLASLRESIAIRMGKADRRGAGEAWNIVGHVFSDMKQFDSAYYAYSRALSLRVSAGDTVGAAASTNNIGNVFKARAQLDSAVVYYRRSIAMKGRDLSGVLASIRNLGLTYADSASQSRQRADSAISVFRWGTRVARELSDTTTLVELLSHMADVFVVNAQLDSAVGYYRASIDTRRSARDFRGATAAYRKLSHVYVRKGDIDSTAYALRAAVAAARQTGDSALVSSALIAHAGNFVAEAKFDSAAHYINQALRVARVAGDINLLGDAYVLNARQYMRRGGLDSTQIALDSARLSYGRTGNVSGQINVLLESATLSWTRRGFDTARDAYRQALAISSRSPDEALHARVLSAYAQFNTTMVGGGDSAIYHAREALRIHRKINDTYSTAYDLYYIGKAHANFDSSRVYLRQALEMSPEVGFSVHTVLARKFMDEGLPDSAVVQGHLARRFAAARGLPAQEVEALQWIGNAYGYGRTKFAPGDPRAPQWLVAAAYYDSAWVVFERLRRQMSGERARIQLSELYMNNARLVSDAYTRHARETGSQTSERMALAADERGRAQALLDMMSSAQTLTIKPLDDAANDLARGLARPGTAAATFTQGNQMLFVHLVLPSGQIQTLQRAIHKDSVARLVRVIRSALGVDAVPASSRDPGVARRTGQTAGVDSSAVAMRQLAAWLFLDTIPKVLAQHNVTDLVIVPSSNLAAVPFAALPMSGDTLAFGIRYRLRYAPSLSVLVEAERRGQERGRATNAAPVVVGNPMMPAVPELTGDSAPLRQLPSSKLEADYVALKLNTKTLSGAAATETRVKEQLPTARIVHLATHGYAYGTEMKARDTFVALAPDARNDGLLTVGEVLDGPRLHADLVVLSACQTALGNLTNAEGTVGLHWAFLAKGARSLLVSLWSVDDKVTQQIMERFYQHWLSGVSKSEALRRAQDDIRKTHPSPRYWAAFQLVGAN